MPGPITTSQLQDEVDRLQAEVERLRDERQAAIDVLTILLIDAHHSRTSALAHGLDGQWEKGHIKAFDLALMALHAERVNVIDLR